MKTLVGRDVQITARGAAGAPQLACPSARRTVLAVAGQDYCIVAASTRMSSGYDILTRKSSKMLQL